MAPTNISLWFQNYLTTLRPYLVMAQNYKVEHFAIQTELDSLANLPNWTSAIALSRAVYHGDLSFDYSWDTPTAKQWRPGTSRRDRRVPKGRRPVDRPDHPPARCGVEPPLEVPLLLRAARHHEGHDRGDRHRRPGRCVHPAVQGPADAGVAVPLQPDRAGALVQRGVRLDEAAPHEGHLLLRARGSVRTKARCCRRRTPHGRATSNPPRGTPSRPASADGPHGGSRPHAAEPRNEPVGTGIGVGKQRSASARARNSTGSPIPPTASLVSPGLSTRSTPKRPTTVHHAADGVDPRHPRPPQEVRADAGPEDGVGPDEDEQLDRDRRDRGALRAEVRDQEHVETDVAGESRNADREETVVMVPREARVREHARQACEQH